MVTNTNSIRAKFASNIKLKFSIRHSLRSPFAVTKPSLTSPFSRRHLLFVEPEFDPGLRSQDIYGMQKTHKVATETAYDSKPRVCMTSLTMACTGHSRVIPKTIKLAPAQIELMWKGGEIY